MINIDMESGDKVDYRRRRIVDDLEQVGGESDSDSDRGMAYLGAAGCL